MLGEHQDNSKVTLLQIQFYNFDQERLHVVLDDHARAIAALHAAVSRYDPRKRDVIHRLGLLHRCFPNLLHAHEARQSNLHWSPWPEKVESP